MNQLIRKELYRIRFREFERARAAFVWELLYGADVRGRQPYPKNRAKRKRMALVPAKPAPRGR